MKNLSLSLNHSILNAVLKASKWMGAFIGLMFLSGLANAAEVTKKPVTTSIQEGTHYEVLSSEAASLPAIVDYKKASKNKVNVLEFFSYGCHWCHQFEPFIETWLKKKPKELGFEQVPVIFHISWQPLSKAFYAAAVLKKSEVITPIIFKAIHEDRANLTSAQSVEEVFIKAGISKEDFSKAYNSFGVTRQIETANGLAKAFQITAIPAVVIIGPNKVYKLTSGLTADTMLEVIDFLVKKENG